MFAGIPCGIFGDKPGGIFVGKPGGMLLGKTAYPGGGHCFLLIT